MKAYAFHKIERIKNRFRPESGQESHELFDIHTKLEISRYFLVLSNLVYMLLGLALFMFGLFIARSSGSWNLFRLTSSESMLNSVQLCTWLARVTGVCAVTISTFGLCGAFTSNQHILGVFFTCLIAMFAMMGALCALCIKLYVDVKDNIEFSLSQSFITNYFGDDGENWQSVVWMHVQKDLQCCGVKDATFDYLNLDVGVIRDETALIGAAFWRNLKANEKLWPASCCKLNDDKEACMNSSYTSTRYDEGCLNKVLNNQQQKFLWICLICLCLFIAQVSHLVMSSKMESSMSLLETVPLNNLVSEENLSIVSNGLVKKSLASLKSSIKDKLEKKQNTFKVRSLYSSDGSKSSTSHITVV